MPESLTVIPQLTTVVLLAASLHALVIVGLAYVAMRLARRRSARIRYRIGYLALLMVAGATTVTTVQTGRVWRHHARAYATLPAGCGIARMSQGERPCLPSHAIGPMNDPVIVSPPAWTQHLSSLWLRVSPSYEVAIGWLWFAAVVGIGVRVLVGCLRWRRVVRAAAGAESSLGQRVQRLAADLGVRASVKVLVSSEVQGPLVIGFIRPCIVIGRSTLSRLDAQSLELLIRHELAHVRRHDAVASLIATIPELLFFFHPAVRRLVESVRHERECACDEQVTEAARVSRRQYAFALYQLARWQDGGISGSAITATGGRLLDRVRRIVSNTPAAEWHRFTRLGFQLVVWWSLILAFGQAGVAAAFAGDIVMRRDMTRRLTPRAAHAPAAADSGPIIRNKSFGISSQ